ncbi:hypothetical protein [Streptomyces sp. NBC_00280]|uniref:hypothetical protein n=1 Tax=Streptomyces sp. NBC_00280 TaxID=2975699 RepID=UPI00324F5B9E
MVNARTFRLWQHLAVSDDLPDQALPAVIEALCAPFRSRYGVSGNGEDWRKGALKEALPVLFRRTTDPALRQKLVGQTDDLQLTDFAEKGLITADDVPVLVHARRVTADLVIGLARHPGQVDAAVGLLSHVSDHDLESVVTHWDLYSHRSRKSVPPIPRELFDAVLERSLTPLAAALLAPEQHDDWTRSLDFQLGFSHQIGDGPDWRVLAKCPERWRELVDHPTIGAAVQHLLLDQAEIEAHQQRSQASASSRFAEDLVETQTAAEPGPVLDEDLLRACLPALCLPELAELPKPSVNARHRLHHIAERVRRNPRLLDLAAHELHEVADSCVRRGRLLAPPRKKQDGDCRQMGLAQDVALLSINPGHLAKVCALLTSLEQPKVVSVPPSRRWSRINDDPDFDSPSRLLERDYQHRRAQALTSLADNPHTPRTAVTDVLAALHPLELTWLTHHDGTPEWLREAAAALAPAAEDEGVLRLLADEELDRHPNPGAILQSWLDAPEKDGVWSRKDVHYVVLRSRHCTLDHLRQLPFDEVLTWDAPVVALPVLLDQCGTASHRWQALLRALDFDFDDDRVTFGQFLDTLSVQPAATAPA